VQKAGSLASLWSERAALEIKGAENNYKEYWKLRLVDDDSTMGPGVGETKEGD
jgi:hypothetical protein